MSLLPLLSVGVADGQPLDVVRRIRLLNGLAVAVIASVVIFTAFELATAGTMARHLWVLHSLSVAISVATLLFHGAGAVRVTPPLNTALHIVASAGASLLTGVPQVGRYYLIVVAITAFYLYRRTWVVVAVFVGAGALFAWIDMGMEMVPRDFIRYIFFFGFLYASVAILNGENLRYLARIERQRDDLRHAHDDLEAAVDTVRAQYETLRVQADDLAALGAIKDRVVSVLSHDLRSPLASLVSVLDLADDGTLDGEMRDEMLREVRRHLAATGEQLDDVLAWAASLLAAAPTAAAELPRVDVGEIAARAVAHAAPRADAKGVALVLDRPGSAVHAATDARHVLLVLRNLISNALKFTPRAGRVEVSVAMEADGAVVVSVRDTGRGMPPEVVATLFDAARPAPEAGTAGETGAGLGLGLCREFAARARARLAVESTPGVGTCVTLRFDAPAAADSPPRTAPAAEPEPVDA